VPRHTDCPCLCSRTETRLRPLRVTVLPPCRLEADLLGSGFGGLICRTGGCTQGCFTRDPTSANSLAVSFFPLARVRRVLQPLPQRGARHPVCHLQGLHLPVRYLSRGGARLLQFLPDMRARRPHQPYDGVVSHPGGVPHGLRVPLPAREHLLSTGDSRAPVSWI